MSCKLLRKQMISTVSRCIYFDAASMAPLPACVGEKMSRFVRHKESLPLDYNVMFGNTVGPCREKLAALINAQPEEIAFFSSVAQGINTAAWCIPFHEGDNVILCDREFASNVYPWIEMGLRRKVEVRIVPNDGGGLTVDLLNRYADSRTKAVSVSSVEFGDGYRTDLAAIGQWCREHQAFFTVDSAQSLGVLPMDVQKYQIDYMAGLSGKWMMGSFGAGFLYVRKELIEATTPPFPSMDSMEKAPDCLDYTPKYKPTAVRFETGALNLPGIAAMSDVMDLCNGIGYENIYAAASDVAAYFTQQLLSLGIRPAPCALKDETRSCIISFEMPDAQAACRFLNEHDVCCVERIGLVRTGIHAYNTREEADRVCSLLKDYLKR